MYNKLLIHFLYIITNIQFIYSYYLIYTYDNITDYDESSSLISTYDKNNVLKKNDILGIKDTFYYSYFCKNGFCTQVDIDYLKPLVEIPDEKGNLKRYIQKSCNYNKLHKCPSGVVRGSSNCTSTNRQTNGQINENCYTDIYISFRCNSDSQCLTNKCIDGYCIFNDKDPCEFCTDIYSNTLFFGRHSYRHCGKAIGDSCKWNKECGSKKCWNKFWI